MDSDKRMYYLIQKFHTAKLNNSEKNELTHLLLIAKSNLALQN